uniref:Uncharacterized protein n=1 Tax=Leptocylindrus danicus TaxID=163516 RepID=A0A7S2KHC4_9STRA|mmetsp:Transcript_22497/g.33737  ORF Transcript_22497/g.33737 Transcript_22497/m.33737 type:complete len:298 (+) Transcript_22497:114-1007(+)
MAKGAYNTSIENYVDYIQEVLDDEKIYYEWWFENYGGDATELDDYYDDDWYNVDEDNNRHHMPQPRFSLDDIESFPSLMDSLQSPSTKSISRSQDFSIVGLALVKSDTTNEQQQNDIHQNWELVSDMESVNSLPSTCYSTCTAQSESEKENPSYLEAVLMKTSQHATPMIQASKIHASVGGHHCIFKPKRVRVTKASSVDQRILKATTNNNDLALDQDDSYGRDDYDYYDYAVQCQKETAGGKEGRKFKGNLKNAKSKYKWEHCSWDREGDIECRRKYKQDVRMMCFRARKSWTRIC